MLDIEKYRIEKHNTLLARRVEVDMMKQRQALRFKKDPVTQAYEDTILAQNRGRDRQGNPIFHK